MARVRITPRRCSASIRSLKAFPPPPGTYAGGGVLRRVLCRHEAKVACIGDPWDSLAGPWDTERRPRCCVPAGRWLGHGASYLGNYPDMNTP
eukprot:364003-Chlamydomonas_euryale.AAC.11